MSIRKKGSFLIRTPGTFVSAPCHPWLEEDGKGFPPGPYQDPMLVPVPEDSGTSFFISFFVVPGNSHIGRSGTILNLIQQVSENHGARNPRDLHG